MRIDILTLFPDALGDVLSESILGRAQERGFIRIEAHQIRDYTASKQNQVDDYPYGGGRGAIVQADPLYRCWEAVCDEAAGPVHTIYLSPCGHTFTQKDAIRLSQMDNLIFVCGHYEGIDQRFIDECVNLYKIPHRVSRENNYEKILSIFNDTLQGRAPHLGIVFGGTPQFLEDQRRGLFSYEALRSRLCDTRFQTEGFRNLAGPVIRLKRLSDDELLALTVRMTALHGQYYGWTPNITPENQLTFLRASLSRAGADSMITPREMLRDLMTLLNILMQNPDATFDDVFGRKSEDGGSSDGMSAEPSPSADPTTEGTDGGPGKKSGAAPFDPADIDF
ncbi:MAG: DUF2791 family P-loop domain-containing protein [Clostridia bacterium]|nr:DUF2791 family P-loop domain-containing protein [Clostridia bacterium]